MKAGDKMELSPMEGMNPLRLGMFMTYLTIVLQVALLVLVIVLIVGVIYGLVLLRQFVTAYQEKEEKNHTNS